MYSWGCLLDVVWLIIVTINAREKTFVPFQGTVKTDSFSRARNANAASGHEARARRNG
jgi:hypothetical protein